MDQLDNIQKRPEILGLTSDEIVDYSAETIREISRELLPLRRRLEELEKEIQYWIQLKRQEQLKCIFVKKIPRGVSGKRTKSTGY